MRYVVGCQQSHLFFGCAEEEEAGGYEKLAVCQFCPVKEKEGEKSPSLALGTGGLTKGGINWKELGSPESVEALSCSTNATSIIRVKPAAIKL